MSVIVRDTRDQLPAPIRACVFDASLISLLRPPLVFLVSVPCVFPVMAEYEVGTSGEGSEDARGSEHVVQNQSLEQK